MSTLTVAGNIVDYGFDDGKKHFVDVRVIVKGEQVIIRLRDDCRQFNPRKRMEIHNLKLNNLIIKI